MKILLVVLAVAGAMLAQDLSGTYTGTLKAETPNGSSDGTGTIILKQTAESLAITAGPQPDRQHPATKVQRDGNRIQFELVPPGDGPQVMKFDVTINEGKLTGKVTMTRGEETRTGQLDLVKQ